MHPFRLILAVAASIVAAKQYRALVHRGPGDCKGCPEAVGWLLQSSDYKFQVTYAGVAEDVQITAESLGRVDVYAHGGGPDINSSWAESKTYAPALRDFVSNGGRYIGICLGAYLAGPSPGFNILPPGVDAQSENDQTGSQVKGEEDTIIQVDWTFQSASGSRKKGETIKDRWAYFQDGAVMTNLSAGQEGVTVLGRYSKTGNVAASLSGFGRGWVALVGPHPEASKDWYDTYNLTNPDGVQFDIGYDFVTAAMGGTSGSTSGVGRGQVNPLGWVIRKLGWARRR